jgi:HEAT repeat protein
MTAPLMIDGDDPATRRASARAAAGDVARLPELLSRLAQERDASVRVALFDAMLACGAAAAPSLASLLSSNEPGLRNGAIEALQTLGVDAVEAVGACLAADDADTRLMAVAVLEALPPAWSRQRLVALLAQEPELNVALAAVEALALIGAPDDVPPLRRFAARHPAEPFVTFAVDLACRRIGGAA